MLNTVLLLHSCASFNCLMKTNLSKFKNKMEFFGLTSFGVTDPIKFLMKPDYKEPVSPPDMKEIIRKGEHKLPFEVLIRELDMYSGFLDGYSYKQYYRLQVSRDKGFSRPIGPKDMYRDPVTAAMDFGWFLNDPDLKGKSWYKNDCYWPRPWSDETKFLNIALLKIKNYKM